MDLNKLVFLITGGTSGIGKALVKEALSNGALVITCGRSQEKLQKLEEETAHPNLFTIRADVSKKEDCRAFVDFAREKAGRIDVLINNAGISMRALFHELKDTDILKRLMDINFWGTVNCTFYAMPDLLQSKGVVVGVSSIAGYRGLPGRTGYSASKYAMQGFLETLRTENLHTGLHVMWVCPGFTTSNIRNTALTKDGTKQGETPLEEGKLMSAEEVARRILKGVTRRKRTVIMTTQGKLTVWMNKLFPSLTDSLVYKHFEKEEGSPLK